MGDPAGIGPEIIAKAPEPQIPNASGRWLTYSPEQLRQVRNAAKEHLSRPASDRFACYATICIAEPLPGWRIATVQRPEFISIACGIADVVISPTRWRYLDCRKSTRLVTANQLRQTGSVEITLGDPATNEWTVTQAFEGASKPWTRHRLYDWRSAEFAEVHQPLDSLRFWPRTNRVAPSDPPAQSETSLEINGRVGGLQRDRSAAFAQPLEGGFLVVDQRHDDLASLGGVGTLDDGDVAVLDAG
eukprot:gene502-701_t